MSYLDDPDFLDSLASLIVQDRRFLRTYRALLSADDFTPRGGDPSGKLRWVLTTLALKHWVKYGEPIGKLLLVTLKKHSEVNRMSPERAEALLDYGKQRLQRVRNPEAVADKLVEWKLEVARAQAIEDLIEKQASGELTTQTFIEIARKAIAVEDQIVPPPEEFFEDIESRIQRRMVRTDNRYPALMIEPFDSEVRAIARGHFGCIQGPYKRGKSLMLLHIALAYVVQRYRGIFITLEDPKEDVEDRFDAAVSSIPIQDLPDSPELIRRHFTNYRRIAKGRLKIYDKTGEGITVAEIEQIWNREKENGFEADFVIVDYDDEILPRTPNKDRRMEFAEIYRDLRKFAARNQLLVWTAAQAKRFTADLKELGGDDLAEDVSKARKVTLLLSLGKSDWGSDAIYLHVAAHKFDKTGFGCHLVRDLSRMLIYDREATIRREAEMRRQEDEDPPEPRKKKTVKKWSSSKH